MKEKASRNLKTFRLLNQTLTDGFCSFDINCWNDYQYFRRAFEFCFLSGVSNIA